MTPQQQDNLKVRPCSSRRMKAKAIIIEQQREQRELRIKKYGPRLRKIDKDRIKLYREWGFTYAELSDMMLVSVSTVYYVCKETWHDC